MKFDLNQFKQQEMERKLLAEKETESVPQGKPYRVIKFVDNVLTVILQDGNILSKLDATESDFLTLRQAKTEKQVISMMTGNQSEVKARMLERERNKNISKGLQLIRESDDFEIEDDSVYLKGIKRSIPPLLVEKFAEVMGNPNYAEDVEYQSLKKFWMKCCLNPNARSAEDLYTFLQHHNFKIDRHGNFYTYRRVVSVGGGERELVDFISNVYSKVKAVWKKKPSDFVVLDDGGEYRLSSIDSKDDGQAVSLGNLEQLYLELPTMKENRYTDAHTHSEDYRVGSIMQMPRQKGDDDNRISCSKGYHQASKAYDYSGFGDTPILAIVNPMDVLAVPLGEVGKLRVCRWFFAMTLLEEEKYILDEPCFDVTDLGDIFEEACLQNMTAYVQNSFAEEVLRHTFNIPNITGEELEGVVSSLQYMKAQISGRIKPVK